VSLVVLVLVICVAGHGSRHSQWPAVEAGVALHNFLVNDHIERGARNLGVDTHATNGTAGLAGQPLGACARRARACGEHLGGAGRTHWIIRQIILAYLEDMLGVRVCTINLLPAIFQNLAKSAWGCPLEGGGPRTWTGRTPSRHHCQQRRNHQSPALKRVG
jgi:hypothetical protein